MNIDQLMGRVERAVGVVKEMTGRLLKRSTLEQQGKLDEIAGKSRADHGDAKYRASDRTHH